MATTKQKQAARQNIKRAREVQSERAHGERVPKLSQGMSSAAENRLSKGEFAFPDERKEPLSDAAHVRNAIARFDQVEGVSDGARSSLEAHRAAAKRFDVEVSAGDWRGCSRAAKPKSVDQREAQTEEGGPKHVPNHPGRNDRASHGTVGGDVHR